MTNSELVLNISETMAMLMRSTGRYVHQRLGTSQGKEAYRLSMQECLNYVTSGLESIDMIKSKIKGHRNEAIHLYTKSFFNKRIEEYRCHEMAIDQALDIVNSLEARFITGKGDSEPRGYRGKEIVYYEDQTLFR